MRGGRGVDDSRLGIAQVGGQGQHAGGIDTAPGLLTAAFDTERQNPSKSALLSAGELVARMLR